VVDGHESSGPITKGKYVSGRELPLASARHVTGLGQYLTRSQDYRSVYLIKVCNRGVCIS